MPFTAATRVLHRIEVNQQPRAVARILDRRLCIAQHARKATDVRAGAESARTVTGDDET